MNIFEIMNNLYTNTKSDWIVKADDVDIKPFLIQRWLAMNDNVRVQTRKLDKYVFTLPPKMYLSLAWTVLPKTQRVPYVKYIKKVEEDNGYDFILSKVRKHYDMSDNDFDANRGRIIKAIENDKVFWFSYYGVEKKHWKKHYLNFDLIKKFGSNGNSQKNLEGFGG